MHEKVKTFFRYLHDHPEIRAQIRARPDATLLYAGKGFAPMWREIDTSRRFHAQLLDKQTLPDVLRMVEAPGSGYATLQAYLEALDPIEPWLKNGFFAWRAVSGIFAANATGKVSFLVGSGVSPDTKVFAATELTVLSRNTLIHPVCREVVEYYLHCIKTRKYDINTSYITA